MNHRVTYRQVMDRLEESNLPHAVISLENDVRIIISQRGGRVFGPFVGQDGESIFLINGSCANPDSFKEFLNPGDWNLEGTSSGQADQASQRPTAAFESSPGFDRWSGFCRL